MHSGTLAGKKERNSGIDFLRILSMFFVVLLHSLGQGGILGNAVPGTSQYKVSWFLEICAYCAVDIFALISGYVSYTGKEKKSHFSGFISLWLQTVLYGLIITAVFQVTGLCEVGRKDYVYAVMPVTKGTYWYFTAYAGLFFLMPFLNSAILHAKETMLRKIAVVIFFAFSVYDMISCRFLINGGYSMIWIVLLYILGAIIKKCDIGGKIKPYQAGIGIVFLYLFTFLYRLHGFEIRPFYKEIFVGYTSPTVLGAAIFYIIAFSKIRFPNPLKRMIGFAAPGAFAVYLLNTHPLVWHYIMKDLFRSLANQSPLKITAFVVGFSLCFVIASILIDRVRIWLFDSCKIKAFAGKAESVLNKMITKISNRI